MAAAGDVGDATVGSLESRVDSAPRRRRHFRTSRASSHLELGLVKAVKASLTPVRGGTTPRTPPALHIMDDPDTILSELRARRQRHAQRTAEQLEDMQREVAAFSGSPLARHDSEPVLSPRIARRTPSRPVAEQSDDELRAQLAALKREEPRLAAPAERARRRRRRRPTGCAPSSRWRTARCARAARRASSCSTPSSARTCRAWRRRRCSPSSPPRARARRRCASSCARARARSSRRTGAPRRRRRARRRRPRRSRRRRAGWRVRTRSSATGGRR